MKVFVQDKESHAAMKRGKAIEKPAVPYSHSIVEPSEEIRLKITNLIIKIFEVANAKSSAMLLNPYILDIALCLASAVNDPYPEAKKAGCSGLVLLVDIFLDSFC
jgi:hypothetical protein